VVGILISTTASSKYFNADKYGNLLKVLLEGNIIMGDIGKGEE